MISGKNSIVSIAVITVLKPNGAIYTELIRFPQISVLIFDHWMKLVVTPLKPNVVNVPIVASR